MPTPRPGLAVAGLWAGPVAIVGEPAVGEALAASLAGHGVSARAVAEVPADAAGVVLLHGLAGVDSADDAMAAQRHLFRTVRSLAPRLDRGAGFLVTVQDSGFATSCRDRAWLGGVAGLARTAAVEWPGLAVRSLDCERGGRDAHALADAIAEELLSGGPAVDVRLAADGTRTTPVLAPATPDAPDGRLDDRSVVVVSGGGRGITAAVVRALAEARRPRLVLLGRTPLEDEPEAVRHRHDERAVQQALLAEARRHGDIPTPRELAARTRRVLAVREVRATLAELRRAGSEARYLCVDVTDAAAVTRALAEVRAEWGPVTGVVHGAGVVADKRIADKTDDQFERVFATKVAGLRALLAATADDPLDLLCVFSSVAAVFGNTGQVDYAMANEVLTSVARAEALRRPGCRVRALAWGPWRGGMVTAGLSAEFDRRGVRLIPTAAGAAAFVAEVTADAADVDVVLAAEAAGPLHGRDPELAAEVVVGGGAHPQLGDHGIDGVAVLPVAMAVEWFLATAAAWHVRTDGDQGEVVLRDVAVVRKVALPDLAATRHRLVVRGRQRSVAGERVLELELTDPTGVVHYRTTAAASTAATAAPTDAAWPRAGVATATGPADVYDGVALFHGPAFQVVRGVPELGRDGAACVVTGLRERSWPPGPWRTDPAALDGALQLAVLWAVRHAGGAWLPMSVGEVRVHRAGPIDDAVSCELRPGRAGGDVRGCDLRLVTETGEPVAELLGVTLVRRPDVPTDAEEESEPLWAVSR